MGNELEVLKKLHRTVLPEHELIDIYYQNRDRYRVLLSLVQQPGFPGKYALSIIPKLYPMDLVRVVKNKRTAPGTRKRVEMEFANKYHKFPLGEKLSYIKVAPASLLSYFTEEQNPKLVAAILDNPFCTEELVIKFINRGSERFTLYDVLSGTEWYKRPRVALAISHDITAPIKIMIAIIPYLDLGQLEKLYKDENTHRSIMNGIIDYLEKRAETGNR